MTRVVLVSGKGGVGKTTVSAASAVAAAKQGYRTLVMSFDIAHSLSDSFNLDRKLFDFNEGLPHQVAPNLDVQEIDIQHELRRQWSEVYDYMSVMLSATGVTDMVAEEAAILPGTEDVISLIYLNKYVKEGRYDFIVVDCPPTGESLRFVNITSTLQWYIRRRFNVDRTLVKFAKPLASKFTNYDLPEDTYFQALERLFGQIQGIETLLTDANHTTVRLVSSAEKMVMRETQRAYLYFNMYGMTVDQVVVNRILPSIPHLEQWNQAQSAYVEQIQDYFSPLPVARLPLFEQEVVGLDRLGGLADKLFKDSDPTERYVNAPPYQFSKKKAGRYCLSIHMPGAGRDEIVLDRQGDDLIVRVGSFRRHIMLPRSVVPLQAVDAVLEKGTLKIDFDRPR
ncbi:ArsA family ATPase [Archangium violaceum]|uniref:ArsA family ATPase n=1 Tax=Archangium violaceum TaxID=83451 RepID=UPI0036D9CC46